MGSNSYKGNGHNEGLERMPIGAEAMLKPLRLLEATGRAFDAAERELTSAIGVPICVQGCGKCCSITTVWAYDVESQQIASWLLGDPKKLTEVLSICEGWLTERDSRLTVYGLDGVVPEEKRKQLDSEVHTLLYTRPCPFLADDKSCKIHNTRPLVCRAYGVTRMASQICPRPLSRLESLDVRAHIGVDSTTGRKLRRMVASTTQAAALVGWTNVRFLATALYMMLRPTRFHELAKDLRIPSAKMAVFPSNPAILFQDQLNAVWADEARLPTATSVQGGKT